MRIIKLKLGKLAGEHIIYDNDDDFLKHHPGFDMSNIRVWGDYPFDKYVVGDWVRYMDGFIGQLLDIYIYKWQTPRFRFRFPNYVSASWWRIKTKDWGYYNIYGNVMHLHESTNLVRIRRKPTRKGIPKGIAKARFVAYILGGIDPLIAYKMIFKRTVTRITNNHVRVLLMDEEVRMEIHEQAASMAAMIKSKFTPEMLVDEMVVLLEKSRKGSEAHRENLRFIMEQAEYIKPQQKKNPKEIGASFSEEKPPESGRSPSSTEPPPLPPRQIAAP